MRTALFAGNTLLLVINIICHTPLNLLCCLLNIYGMWDTRPECFR